MVAPECPRPEVLRAYAVGNLPEVEGEAVMQHLETCSACEATIASLGDSSDTLVNALARSRCDDPFLLEPELGPMLARVQSIGVNLGDEARSVPDVGAEEPPSRIGQYQLLAPRPRGNGNGLPGDAHQIG